MDNEQIKKEIDNLKQLKAKLTGDLKDVEVNINSMIERLESKIKPLNVCEKYGINEFPCDYYQDGFLILSEGSITKTYSNGYESHNLNYAKYPTKEKTEKVSKLCYLFRKALHVMEQLNEGYEWKQNYSNYIVEYNYDLKQYEIIHYSIYQRSIFYFPTYEKAQAFFEIMGESDLKTLYGIKEQNNG